MSILAVNTLIENGFVRYPSAPAPYPLAMSSSVPFAVRKMTGIWDVSWSERSLRQSSIPSMSGIMTSRMTTSGQVSLISASPFSGDVLDRTVKVSPRLSLMNEMISALSSMTTIFLSEGSDKAGSGPWPSTSPSRQGMVKVKELPSPRTLSTEMLPPWSSTKSFVSPSPIPVLLIFS